MLYLKMKEFDVNRLCESTDKNEGRFRAVFNPKLKETLKTAVIKINLSPTTLAKHLGLSYPLLWDYLNRRPTIPLIYLKEIENKSRISLCNYIDYVEYSTGQSLRRTKVVKKLTEELAKVLGAHAADGHLKKRKTMRSGKYITRYELVLREEFKSNVEVFCKWFNLIFDVNLKPRKASNHWFIYVGNKAIFRYFKNLFGFPAGRKTEIVNIPDFIKTAPKNIKRAFVTGVLMFDGSVNYRNGYIELYSKSKNLISGISTILKELNIAPDYLKLSPDKYQRFRLVIRKKEKLKRALALFEPETEKWRRLKDQVYGFESVAKSETELISELDHRYPRVRPTTITFSDIVKAIWKLEKDAIEPNFNSIAKKLKRRSTVVYEFLKKLEDWNMLKSKRKGNKKVWRIKNEQWRLKQQPTK